MKGLNFTLLLLMVMFAGCNETSHHYPSSPYVHDTQGSSPEQTNGPEFSYRYVEALDIDSDGDIDSFGYVYFNTDQDPVREEWDDDLDGETDDVMYMVYDESGLKIREDFDIGCNRTIDFRKFYVYDDEKRIERTEYRDETDDDAMDVHWFYDNSDLLSMRKKDLDLDGDYEIVEYFSYAIYSSTPDRLLRVEIYNLDELKTEEMVHFRYNSEGFCYLEEHDEGDDGTIDFSFAFSWEPNPRAMKTQESNITIYAEESRSLPLKPYMHRWQ